LDDYAEALHEMKHNRGQEVHKENMYTYT